MGTVSDIREALDRVEEADEQLIELAELCKLNRLVNERMSMAITAALTIYTPTQVGRACGTSRQAMAKRRPSAA